MPQSNGDPPEPDDIVVMGDTPRRRVHWASWLTPVLAAGAVAIIGVGVAVAASPGGGHHHQAAAPTSHPTLTRGPTPPTRPHHRPSPTSAATVVAHRATMPAPSTPGRTIPTIGTPGTGPATSPGPASASSTPPAPATHTEEGFNKNGVPTFSNYQNASGPGPVLTFGELVQVSCKVYDPTIPSASPGGYWYRIASTPWVNAYYAVANTFLNGDPPGGPYTHNYDPSVPDC
jgi:hypothetical protein